MISKLNRTLLLALSITVAFTGSALAQVIPPTPPTGLPPGVEPQQTRRPSRDTTNLRDSLRNKEELVQWGKPDSLLQELTLRKGRTLTRFQSDSMVYDGSGSKITLYGSPAVVQRDSAVIVGDTIIYDDSTQTLTVRGKLIKLRDPSRNEADVEARDSLFYSMATGRADLYSVSTLTMEAGEIYSVKAKDATLIGDSTSGGRRMYGHVGTITTCSDHTPHYHFLAKRFKMVFGRYLVAAPAYFYIADVPVAVIPFLINDLRQGRRSGILTLRAGITDVVRNSSRGRQVDNLGFYWAMSDYTDAQVWMDWRSGSGGSSNDPGRIRFAAEMQYKLLSRFLMGKLGLAHATMGGSTNTSIAWSHQQDFSSKQHLSMDLNFVTNTQIQQREEVVTALELATIRSGLNYQQQLGNLNISLGGRRTQYPGQKLVDQTLPTLSVSSKPIALAKNASITPGFSFNNSERFNVERSGPLSQTYFTLPDGSIDSLQVSGNSRNSSASLDLPLTLGRFRWTNSFQMTDVEDNFPQIFVVRAVNDTSDVQTRVYARTFRTDIDWRTNVSLPATFFAGTLNVSPSVGITNAHPGPYWVRSERSGGAFVAQGKRPVFGLAMSPTLYGEFGGIGPFAKVRHVITTTLGYSYSPPADVGDDYLQAIGSTRQGYLGGLAQSQVSLGMNHVFEAKLRSDTLKKITLLALNLSSLTWDFERAKATKGTGLASDRFLVNARSDLLPGLDFSADYSLFQGSILSDSAKLKPFLTGLRASMSMSKATNPISGMLSLFRKAPVRDTSPEAIAKAAEAAQASEAQMRRSAGAAGPAVGGSLRDPNYSMGPLSSWNVRLDFTMSRQRPPTGNVIIIENDARARCQALGVSPFAFEQCVREFEALAVANLNAGLQPPGGAFIREPARTSLAASVATPLTKNWSLSWSTSYDFVVRDFANHSVSLERNMHDATASFSFSQSPNGNFMFSFVIALKANKDIKFDYRDASYSR